MNKVFFIFGDDTAKNFEEKLNKKLEEFEEKHYKIMKISCDIEHLSAWVWVLG